VEVRQARALTQTHTHMVRRSISALEAIHIGIEHEVRYLIDGHQRSVVSSKIMTLCDELQEAIRIAKREFKQLEKAND
jgi:hypothetical protein